MGFQRSAWRHSIRSVTSAQYSRGKRFWLALDGEPTNKESERAAKLAKRRQYRAQSLVFVTQLLLSINSNSSVQAASLLATTDTQHVCPSHGRLDHRSRTLKKGRTTTVQIPDDERPRYAIKTLDVAEEAQTPCACFVVPRGREHEFVFSSDEGLAQVAGSAKCARLLVVNLDPQRAGHSGDVRAAAGARTSADQGSGPARSRNRARDDSRQRPRPTRRRRDGRDGFGRRLCR